MTPSLETLIAFARRMVRGSGKAWNVDELAERLAKSQPQLANIFHRGLLQGYLYQARAAASPLGLSKGPPSGPTGAIIGGGFFDSGIRFPGVEAAANWLMTRQLMTPGDFQAIDAQAQRAAFTLAGATTLQQVSRVRDAIAESYLTGDGLQAFSTKVERVIQTTPARIETIYRTHVGLAQAAGQRAVYEHPMVEDEFPYRLWSSTHDSRTRATHLAMEKHGQNGTGVYRADDPMWETLWPPAEWSCRCNVIPLTLEDAAQHGSREAQRWLRTGQPPVVPEMARVPYPIVPAAGWPTHKGVSAVV